MNAMQVLEGWQGAKADEYTDLGPAGSELLSLAIERAQARERDAERAKAGAEREKRAAWAAGIDRALDVKPDPVLEERRAELAAAQAASAELDAAHSAALERLRTMETTTAGDLAALPVAELVRAAQKRTAVSAELDGQRAVCLELERRRREAGARVDALRAEVGRLATRELNRLANRTAAQLAAALAPAAEIAKELARLELLAHERGGRRVGRLPTEQVVRLAGHLQRLVNEDGPGWPEGGAQ